MLSLLQTLCSSTSPGHLQRDETGASSGLNWPTFIRVCKQHMIDTSHSFVKFQDCIRLGQCGAQEFSKTPAPAATVFSAWAPCLSPQPALHALTKSNSTTLAVQAAHASASASFRAVASTAVPRLAARASRHPNHCACEHPAAVQRCLGCQCRRRAPPEGTLHTFE